MTEPYKALGISDAVLTFGEKVLAGLAERFAQIDAISEANQMKVIAAMQKNRLAANHFNLTFASVVMQNPNRNLYIPLMAVV